MTNPADMASYDSLGPLTRAVIAESPIEIYPVMRMVAEAGFAVRNLETGEIIDAKLAAWLERQISARYGRPAGYYRLAPRRKAYR